MNIQPILFILLLSITFGCDNNAKISACETGGVAASHGQFPLAIQELDQCLSIAHLDQALKTKVLRARAWAHYNLHNETQAIVDQEEAFKLGSPRNYEALINYASYLRSAQRYQDSLAPLYQALAIDEKNAHVRMMTLYNLGWSLQKLGEYQQSIDFFTKGIPAQPEFPFVYWKRGLSYHALGLKEEAKKDFQQFRMLYNKNNLAIPPSWKQEILDTLSLYKLTLSL